MYIIYHTIPVKDSDKISVWIYVLQFLQNQKRNFNFVIFCNVLITSDISLAFSANNKFGCRALFSYDLVHVSYFTLIIKREMFHLRFATRPEATEDKI